MPQAPRGPKPSPELLRKIAAQQQMQRRPPALPPQGVPMGIPQRGAPGMKKGGAVDGVAKRGKTKGKVC